MRISAPEEYLNNYMLGKSETFEDFRNYPAGLLMVSLLAAWIVVVLSLLKGIKTSGK
ncbi:hypothetical protein CEXT_108661, partial [Caerostris extrusa]